jgi:hypothetical protein
MAMDYRQVDKVKYSESWVHLGIKVFLPSKMSMFTPLTFNGRYRRIEDHFKCTAREYPLRLQTRTSSGCENFGK